MANALNVHDIRVVVTEEDDVDHARHQIRDAAVAALTAALVPGTAKTVEAGRVHPLLDTDLPAVSVFTASESWDPERDVMEGGGVARQWRRLELVLEIRAQAASGDSPSLLAVLDTVALEAERALEGDATLTGLLQELNLRETGTELEGGDTNQPVGVLTQAWEAGYRCNPADPAIIA